MTTDETPEKPEAPRRYLDATELSVEQLIQREQARKRGEPEPRFETPDYIEAKRQLLSDHGFDETDDEQPVDVSEWTVEQHIDHISRRNR